MNMEMSWEIVGWVGQVFFGGRFLIQWIATERRKQSVVPPVFWYLSMVGTLFLLAYSIHAVKWPLIAGFSLNMIVYVRNMYFIRRAAAATATTASEPPALLKGRDEKD